MEEDSSAISNGAAIALIRALQYANVKLLRFVALDAAGQLRCKATPVAFLQRHPEKLAKGVCFAQVCFAGLPSFGDVMQVDSGLTAAGTVTVRPDLSTLRLIPYAPDSALVLGRLYSEEDECVSDLCCRSLLQRVVEEARREHNVKFTVGVELEFVLLDAQTAKPVEHSNFADTKLLNQQQAFITAVGENLQQQEISIELLHAESAPGQMEVVLEYLDDPIKLIDHAVLTRQTIQALAHQHGMKALFLPKTTPEQAGNGCHLHLSFVDYTTGRNKFGNDNSIMKDPVTDADKSMSLKGQAFVEGILMHLPSLLALTMPTANSFRRIGPGCWTGHQVSWGVDDKEVPLRVVGNHVEYKLCDGMSNLYLSLASILIAGMDSYQKNMVLRPSYKEMKSDELVRLPTSPSESLNLLEQDALLQEKIPSALMKGYLAIRRSEAERAVNMLIEDEVHEAIMKA